MIAMLLESAVRAFLVALLVAAGMRIFRVKNIKTQKAAWGLVLIAAFATPLAMRWQWPARQFVLSLPTSLLAAESHAGSAPSAPVAIPTGTLMADTALEPVSMPSGRYPVPAVSHYDYAVPEDVAGLPAAESPWTIEGGFGPRALSLPNILDLLYLVVAVVLLLRLVVAAGSAIWLWQTADFAALPPELAQFAKLRLRSSSRVASPVTIGSGTLLPAHYRSWDLGKLRMVLAHERSHIHQRDSYLQFFAGLYAAFFWFSPLGWWLKNKLSDLAEAIGDHAGLEEAGSRSTYARLLLEFAALPRPTLIGVAMARTSNVSHRIERLLNESSFRQAFAAGRRSALFAVVLLPVALFAATSLVRVEAAKAQNTAAVPASQQPATPSEPQTPSEMQTPTVPAAPAAPNPAPEPSAVPAPPEPPDLLTDDGNSILISPGKIHIDANPVVIPHDEIHIVNSDHGHNFVMARGGDGHGFGFGYGFGFAQNGDSWAVVPGPNGHASFSGDWTGGHDQEIEKATRLAHGKFLWFARDGKSYFVDDPAVVSQIEALYAPMEALGRQQAELGRQQQALGRQQQELGRKQGQVKVTPPDLSREMADLDKAMAKLKEKLANSISQEQLSNLQGKMAEMQAKLGAMQGKIGAQQGVWGAMQGKLGEEQGKLGAEQGRLGAEQGKLAEEANRKVKSIIDQSLHNGKAKPVE